MKSFSIAIERLIGTWELVSFQLQEDGGPVHPWGFDAHGFLVYAPSGHMSVAINRFAPWGGGSRPAQAPEDSSLQNLFYAGTYRVEDGVVKHDVLNASDPDRIGATMIRTGHLKEDVLTLVSKGAGLEATIVWRRVPEAAMTEASARKTAEDFWRSIASKDWARARALLSDSFTAYWPQSREKIPSPESFIAINRDYPGQGEITLCECRVGTSQEAGFFQASTVVRISWQKPNGTPEQLYAVSLLKIGPDGRIANATEFWAETYERPEWRRGLTELVGGVSGTA